MIDGIGSSTGHVWFRCDRCRQMNWCRIVLGWKDGKNTAEYVCIDCIK